MFKCSTNFLRDSDKCFFRDCVVRRCVVRDCGRVRGCVVEFWLRDGYFYVGICGIVPIYISVSWLMNFVDLMATLFLYKEVYMQIWKATDAGKAWTHYKCTHGKAKPRVMCWGTEIKWRRFSEIVVDKNIWRISYESYPTVWFAQKKMLCW